MDRSTPRRQPRAPVEGPLELTAAACEDTQEAAERAVTWGLEMLREDELALIAAGELDAIAFGRWLTLPLSPNRTVYDLVSKNLPKLVKGLVKTRLTDNYRPHGRFTQVTSVAEAAGVDRGDVFRGWAPRGLLLIRLVHAYLVAIENQPRLAALIFYSDADFGGPDANAYGLHRVKKGQTLSRLAGLGGLGPDLVIPHSCLPYAVGLRCDPAHPEADEAVLASALEELEPFGFDAVPSSHADHFEFFLTIERASRAVLGRARSGSRVCGRARVDPNLVLNRAFPRWLTVGSLPMGIHELAPRSPAEVHMPGADAELLRLAQHNRMWPVFVLFDSAEETASERAMHDLLFCDGENRYSGRQFMEIVCSSARRDIPGLRPEPAHVLRSLGALPELAELRVKIDPKEVDWFWCHGGLSLLEGRGQGISQNLLVRSTQSRTTGYVVLSDLNDSELRANAIARADLHFLSAIDNTRSECVSRVFGEYELHVLKTWKFKGRSWLRHAALLSNPPVVDVGRRRQSGQ